MIVIVAGVSGSGKTTVGSLLAERLGWPFVDGDLFHPAANLEKMTRGVALTDADRWPWLAAIGSWMDGLIVVGGSGVVACSALKLAYRDALIRNRDAARIVFLDIGREVNLARLKGRRGHFFPSVLLDSQLDDLELPIPAEGVLMISNQRSPNMVVEAIISGLSLS